MIIQIDVPDTTYAISVTVLYKQEASDSLVSRCFRVTDGVVADENGGNKVVADKGEIANDRVFDAMLGVG